jgi:hypothetical protein
MLSLTSARAKRIRGPKKFSSPVEKDYFNTIGTKRKAAPCDECQLSEQGSKAEVTISELARIPRSGHSWSLRA